MTTIKTTIKTNNVLAADPKAFETLLTQLMEAKDKDVNSINELLKDNASWLIKNKDALKNIEFQLIYKCSKMEETGFKFPIQSSDDLPRKEGAIVIPKEFKESVLNKVLKRRDDLMGVGEEDEIDESFVGKLEKQRCSDSKGVGR